MPISLRRFSPLASFDVALFCRPEEAETEKPRRGEPRLGWHVAAPSGRDSRSATSKLRKGGKRTGRSRRRSIARKRSTRLGRRFRPATLAIAKRLSHHARNRTSRACSVNRGLGSTLQVFS